MFQVKPLLIQKIINPGGNSGNFILNNTASYFKKETIQVSFFVNINFTPKRHNLPGS